ncbi:acyl-CoA dehydrogenase [Sneathiella sp. P13V-1]|uniref:acyl-CoA dehydrogenase family protein n=1 Tax=Sneathiella sp. P13V-1 TaxID=2697366 RepID=UPI00187BC14D|nr:acyl-CoA dehydrogenase family protein [Sneathiella sp. P13V-1]MBE7637486.1 acyl-CoA dehydrogenase [Sneathiella sp. P13V-1]
MEFELNDELRQIYQYGDSLAQKFDFHYWLEHARAHTFPTEMFKQIAEDGFLGMMVPEEYGGAGLGMQEMSLFMEGTANNGIPLLMMVVGPCMAMSHLASHGTDFHKKEILPAACRGDMQLCFAITEPGAGSNSMQITTIAKPKGDRFSLSGEKTFITGADLADYCLVVARTTPFGDVAQKTDGFTIFLVDLKKKGVDMQRVKIAVPVPEQQWTLFFDEVDLGPEDVVGEVDKGFNILFDTLNPERITVAGMCAGVGRYALGRAVEYASERKVFGQPIGAHQGLQHPLAKAKANIELASLMARKAAWQFDKGLAAGEASNMAKYAAAEAGIEAVDAAIQAFGGSAYTEDTGIFEMYPMLRVLRTAPVNRELCLSFIGEKVMGLPRSY